MLVLVSGACGSAVSDLGDNEPIAGGPTAPDAETLRVACGNVDLGTPANVVLPETPMDDSAVAAVEEAMAAIGGEAELFSFYAWSIATRDDSGLVLFGRAIDDALTVEAAYADAELLNNGSAWRFGRWGQCRIVVDAPGYGNARVVLDPQVEPDPSGRELHVWINERACANGEAPIGREVLPVVVTDEDRVVVTMLVEPVTGDATCPSNPWHPTTIGLGDPLGDRQVFDGSTVPPVLRPWPPTQESLDG
jgi:hypothetical protein